jgi:hypothetical protein
MLPSAELFACIMQEMVQNMATMQRMFSAMTEVSPEVTSRESMLET